MNPAFKGRPVRKGLVIGCLVCLGLFLLALGTAIFWFVHVTQDPKGVVTSADGPTEVQQSETFDLVVRVTNERKNKSFRLSDIDVSEEYLKGFVVVAVEPQAKSSKHIPFDNSRSFTFDVPIPPRETKSFTFKLRAARRGLFRGDVDVCEGQQFITTMAQTDVK